MEKSRQVCAVPREGWERGGMLSGPAALPPAALQTTPPCTAYRAPGKGLRGERAADESLDFVHSIAETPALLLPHTSGEREGGRAGWMERGTGRGAGVGLPHSACAGGAGCAGGKSRALLSLVSAGKGLCSVT